ncbi:hypothetical protein ES705_15640 [subsurface metagenome]
MKIPRNISGEKLSKLLKRFDFEITRLEIIYLEIDKNQLLVELFG